MSDKVDVSFRTAYDVDLETQTLDLLNQVMRRFQQGPHRTGDNERVAAYFYSRWTEDPDFVIVRTRTATVGRP